ncbi:MAG: hydantoinase B/oxoprolinase family protein [Balneolaceae bacterium]
MNSQKRWEICVDTGGTFTDCIAIAPGGERRRVKVLSSSSLRGNITEKAGKNLYKVEQEWNAPDDFIRNFIFSLLYLPNRTTRVTGFNARESLIELEDTAGSWNEISGASFEVKTDEEAPVLAARLATKTPAVKNLPPMNLRLATTKGTNALLENKGAPTVLFVTEGFEDLLVIGTQQRPDLFSLNIKKPAHLYDLVLEVPERLSAEGKVLKQLELEKLSAIAGNLLEKGIRTAGIALMHSYRNALHEAQLKKWLLEKGFIHVSTSSELTPFIGILARAETTLVNATLAPIIRDYLDSVKSGTDGSNLFVMTSAGGLTPNDSFTPKDGLLSGPAGGVVGASSEGKKMGFEKVISFDMGGTSTDVARFDSDFDYAFEHTVGNAHLVAPALSIETVAAGGGSICSFDGHALCVGPESAGAWPGPACYGAGGPLTITDINLLTGRLDQQNFHIPVDIRAAEQKLEEILLRLKSFSDENITKESVLESFLQIANERMAGAISKISVRKGYDTKEYALVSFGGAGGQHACAVAKRLQIQKIVVPDEAGLLSATGLHSAVIEEFAGRQILKPLTAVADHLDEIMSELAERAMEKIHAITGSEAEIQIRRKLLSMRFEGQESTLEIDHEPGKNPGQLFRETYESQYGHWISGRVIELESARVVASTKAEIAGEIPSPEKRLKPDVLFEKKAFFNGKEFITPVYVRSQLQPGSYVQGPALVLDPYSTTVIEPGWNCTVYQNKSLVLTLGSMKHESNEHGQPEAARLELFTNRFSSIATEMGEMLQRTALSVNVKDRLDFSCALLSPDGELVVNAPHIPVHLGALGLCVRNVMKVIEMEPGDVVITNHPAYGGSHLPDVTVITPVFTDDEKLIGYAASRAHHAEIGGKDPGSMPPDATTLIEEGVVLPPMHLIKKGKEQWDLVRAQLQNARYPTRNVEENLADLQAAVAANHRGAMGLNGMAAKYGADQVLHYMSALKEYAASKLRATLKQIPEGEYISEEFLDDGTPLKALFKIEKEKVSIDFTGTGPVHSRNLNATPAIVNSVIMYVLRLLINQPLPLNEGILTPVTIRLPESLLNPGFHDDPEKCPAVVGGNIEVSQRLVDTLLKPFKIIACSQGTMNNVLFGNDRFGYYETVGGGTGAGRGFHGADGVHHHMTNTRGTDPEILEHRYPVRLNRYAIRKNSGGPGKWNGGNGIIRELQFLEPVRLTVLTQHRVEKPYGLNGGNPGKTGRQWVIRADGTHDKLNPTDGQEMNKGDRLILKTPGGGGFGDSDSNN